MAILVLQALADWQSVLVVCYYTHVRQSGKVHPQGAKRAFEKSTIKGSEFCMLDEDEEDRTSLCILLHPTGAQWMLNGKEGRLSRGWEKSPPATESKPEWIGSDLMFLQTIMATLNSRSAQDWARQY